MEKNKDPEFEIFSEAHLLYGGRKRFVTTEFKNLKENHKDWKEILPLLKKAIENQIAWRKEKDAIGSFAPEWKQFSNWINARDWEYSYPLHGDLKSNVSPVEKIPYF